MGPGQWDDWYAKWAAADIEQVTPAFRCLMDRDDITGRLGEINCPALIVHGSADAAISLAKAQNCATGSPDLRGSRSSKAARTPPT